MTTRIVRLLLCLAVLASPVAAQELFFSEYIEGSSNNKALEIYNPGSAVVSLTGTYNVQMFFNGSTSAGLTINLIGTVAAGDVFVLAHSSADPAILAQADQTNGAGWFNGDDAVVLRRGSTVLDVIGQIGFDPGTEWGTGVISTADNTLRRKTAITGGDTNGSDPFDPSAQWDGFATNTFSGLGTHNASLPPPPPPPVEVKEIFDIQSAGMASPYSGQKVRTLDNVVTAVGRQGFFIQTPDSRADASAETSNGIYVFTGGTPTVTIGDQIDVEGTVTEFFNLTELSDRPTITKIMSGVSLPAYVAFGPDVPSPLANRPANEMERFEGMLVRMIDGVVAAPTDRFGDITVVATSSRPFREPGLNWDGNPEKFEIDPDALGLPAANIAGGSTISIAEGPLSFAFGNYQIWPTKFVWVDAPLPQPPRAAKTGEVTIAAQNLLRLFDHRDDPTLSEPIVPQDKYHERLQKLSLHIREVLGSPDVVAVSEVEDLVVLQDVAARVNAGDPSLQYTAYSYAGHDPGGIDVGFLVNSTVRVSAVAQLGAGETFEFAGNTDFLHDRPPLLLEGWYVANGEPFEIRVIAVHQRSLNDIETNPRVVAKRRAQAESLAAMIETQLALRPDVRLVVIGDFNAFEFDDGYVDVMAIVTEKMNNQVLTLPTTERYSFIHQANAQTLDHALTSGPLEKWLRGFQFARSNADAPFTFGASATTPLGFSDHDAPVLFVMTDWDGDDYPDDVDACPRGDARPTVIIGNCDSGVENEVFTGGCSITDEIKKIKAGAKNHGQYVSGVTKYVKSLELTGVEQGAIVSCAARDN